MKYKKVECINCGKEFRQVLDHAWIIHCSQKCIDEYERSGTTFKKDDRDFRRAS